MFFRAAAVALIALAAPSPGAEGHARASAQASDPRAWTIGPLIRGRNHSYGMPLRPSAGPGRAWHIELPQAPGSVHYVTFRHGSLAGKRRIVMRYRVEAAPGVRMVPRRTPGFEALITPYFQRGGDNWTARGPFEAYRWYATFASRALAPGVFEIVAPLDANWTAVETSSARNNPAGFRGAVAHADQVGFVLGSREGYGKGVYATGPARLVVTEFRVE